MHRPRSISRFWRDADLPGIEIRWARFRTAAFPKHTHDCYSVGLAERGESEVFLAGRGAVMGPGEIAVMHPQEVHACNPRADTGWTYRMVHIDTDVLAAAARSVWDGAHHPEPGFARPMFRDPELSALFTRLHRAVAAGADPLAKDALLESALARLLSRHADAARPVADGGGRAVQTVRELLHDHPAEAVRLSDLAEATGLSRYAVLRAFRRATGLTPHAYQTQLRIALAKRLMRSGASIADAALAAGYADQSHFTNAFRSVTGTTPRLYRQAL